MKSKQVGYVLMALIAVGLAGLIARVVSSGSDELTLSGLLPIARDVVDKITIRQGDNEVEIVKIGDSDTWWIGQEPVFPAKLEAFWGAVEQIDGAQLIATNPDNHERMGVSKGQGTSVSFFRGPSIMESFILGKWTPDVRLCYLRRAGKPEVYGIPCPVSNLFDANRDGWRNPVAVSIPAQEVASVAFSYPDEQFDLVIGEDEPMVVIGDSESPADFFQTDSVLSALESLVVSEFAPEDETRQLNFTEPDVLVRVSTKDGSTARPTTLRLLERGDGSYYLKLPTGPSVYVIDQTTAQALLKRAGDLLVKDDG